MDGWKMSFLLGFGLFSGAFAVSFREGIFTCMWLIFFNGKCRRYMDPMGYNSWWICSRDVVTFHGLRITGYPPKKSKMDTTNVSLDRCFSFKYGTLRVWNIEFECCSELKLCTNVCSYNPSWQSCVRKIVPKWNPLGILLVTLLGWWLSVILSIMHRDLQWSGIKRSQKIMYTVYLWISLLGN